MMFVCRTSPCIAAAALLVLTSCAPAGSSAETSYQPAALTAKQQAKLDRKLAGRVAGEPVSCIASLRGAQSTTISDDILLYEVGGTVYLNQPYGGCNGAENNTLIIRRPTSQLCSGEIAVVSDFSTGTELGSCALGKFTPYRMADSPGG